LDKEHFKYLFRLYVSGKCTPQERDEFFDLLEAHKEDETIISLMDGLYSEIRMETPSASYVNNQGRMDLAGPAHQPGKVVPLRSRFKTYRWAAAAALLLLITAGGWLLTQRHTDVALATNTAAGKKVEVVSAFTSIRTGNHEKKVIVLTDSTRIVLNGATELRYPDHFDPEKREVYLEGEAFFEVSNAAAWPFVIRSAGGMSTTVLGTSFNIKAYPDRRQAIVSVVTGKVKITRNEKDISILIKGQELRMTMQTGAAEQRNTGGNTIAGWQTGDISFNDETLEDILKDLQIFYGVNIRISNAGLANLVITTGFKKNTSIENALDVVCELANARYTKNNEGYVVY